MSKILYRPHRGGLADAMVGIKEFNSEKEFKDYIVTQDKKLGYNIRPEDITIELYSDTSDSRIGWPNSYIVTGSFIEGFLTYNLSKEECLKVYKEFLNKSSIRY